MAAILGRERPAAQASGSAGDAGPGTLAHDAGKLPDVVVDLVQCLEALQDQTEDPCFRIIIRDVRLDISSGNSFSASVKKFPKSFPNLFISMVEAGEASGALAEILSKVAGYFESSVKL